MTLSLDSIYRPFNEFFFQKFIASEGEPVTFRFAHQPPIFADSDFLNPLHPEWGSQQTVADELFSTVVDGVPRLDADGRTVWLQSASQFSDVYHDEILGPAIPFVPTDVTDDSERQARIDAFNTAKADAIKDWNNKASSLLEGPGVEFRPSAAMPPKWWDRNAGVWTHQSFQVKGAATVPGQPQRPPDRLLRMKAFDKVLVPTLLMARPAFTAALASDSLPSRTDREDVIGALSRSPEVLRPDRPLTSTAIHDDLRRRIASFPFKQRLEIESMIAADRADATRGH